MGELSSVSDFNLILEKTGKEQLGHVMQQRICPIKASDIDTGERLFCFRVYFDRVSRRELESLRWSMDFTNAECAHKLGRGKSFGFGSVRIQINDLKIQNINLETGEMNLISMDYKELGENIDESSGAIESLKLMANWKKRPHDVSYPILGRGKSEEAFRWFVENRNNIDSKGMQPAFLKVLPKAVEERGEKRNTEKRLSKE